MTAGNQFRDLADFWSEGLALPIKGKTYLVPEPNAEDGLLLQSIFSAGLAIATAPSGEEPADAIANMARLGSGIDDTTNLYRRCLGSVYDEMIADGLSLRIIRHAAQTALFWVAIGEAEALAYWERPANPTPPAPANRETRRRATKATTTKATPSPRSRATAAGRSTRKAG